MSDSDDTDVLLLIPPDLFLVPSSDSDSDSHFSSVAEFRRRKNGVVTEISERALSPEDCARAIESWDNGLAGESPLEVSTEFCRNADYNSSSVGRSPESRCFPRFSGASSAPTKLRTSSRPHYFPFVVDKSAARGCAAQNLSFADPTDAAVTSRYSMNFEEIGESGRVFDDDRPSERAEGGVSSNGTKRDVDGEKRRAERTSSTIRRKPGRDATGTELSEADEPLRETETTEDDPAERIDGSNAVRRRRSRPIEGNGETLTDGNNVGSRKIFGNSEKFVPRSDAVIAKVEKIMDRDFGILGEYSRGSAFNEESRIADSSAEPGSRSLPDVKYSARRTDRAESRVVDDTTSDATSLRGAPRPRYAHDSRRAVREILTAGNRETGDDSSARTVENCQSGKCSDFGTAQRLLALSDFWRCDGKKSREETLRIKLEEEKFRREHCEHLIQELQKRLLEQQEKVAVAIRVDNEKNAAISQFREAWSKLRQRWDVLEKERAELEMSLETVTERHCEEAAEYQLRIKRGEGELSKALDLAAGYKEKSDTLTKEKLKLLKAHADELEKYKFLVREAEQRNEILREDYSKLLEKNKRTEELGDGARQELNRERSRSAEVRTEMGVIRKALDACEAELTVLRQEKENLHLKVKEELRRNEILERNKVALLEAANDAKNAEKIAKEETGQLADRQEQIRSELREIYQNQLDDVVKTKLKEFQEQLDAAELAFQMDLETRQRAIAECAARKIKSIIDKHQLEINLLEEKHRQEKRLSEIQLAQASQRACVLEVQLTSQRAGKTQLAEQLHSVMQKQWQQALQIISGGQMENLAALQRLNAERISDAKSSKRCSSACCNKDNGSSRSETRSLCSQNLQNLRQERGESLVTLASNDETPATRRESMDELRKYIKMILDMQQPSKDEYVGTKFAEAESNPSSPLVIREVPRKHYTKRETNGLSEESIAWQHIHEESINDTSEYMQTPLSQESKADQRKVKPPWK